MGRRSGAQGGCEGVGGVGGDVGGEVNEGDEAERAGAQEARGAQEKCKQRGAYGGEERGALRSIFDYTARNRRLALRKIDSKGVLETEMVCYRSMMVMRGATSVDAQAAAVMSLRTRWGRRSVFHFEGVLGRGGEREAKWGPLAAELRVKGGGAGSGRNGSTVIVCELN